MLVRCISVSEESEEQSLGRFAQVLTIGTNYVVAAITFSGPSHLVLINPDHGVPAWLPLGLFDLVDGTIPRNWISGVSNETDATSAALSARITFGYEEVVVNPHHYRDLVDGSALARKIFEDELRERTIVEEARFTLRAVSAGELTRTEAADWAREWLETEGHKDFQYPNVIWEVVSDMVGLDTEDAVDSISHLNALIRQLS